MFGHEIILDSTGLIQMVRARRSKARPIVVITQNFGFRKLPTSSFHLKNLFVVAALPIHWVPGQMLKCFPLQEHSVYGEISGLHCHHSDYTIVTMVIETCSIDLRLQLTERIEERGLVPCTFDYQD